MAELPSGTVTFLFTDIEGSTARWEGQPEAMRVALARHDVLLRTAILEHGGHVVKTMGDAFHAAFSRAPDAVAAALDAQRRLQGEPWEAVGPIRVRMAVHTGAAEERDGDYYGPLLNRAARLMSAGHGGQTLLSQATYELVRDTPLDGVMFIDLGEHRLKDLIRPERVFQVVAPDLASDFPPLASLDAHPNNLPTHPTTLLGRERELAEISALLRGDARLVTLTGPGGTGKTRLSLQVTADLVDDFEHGVYLIELAPITDPTLVPSTIAQVLGVRDVGNRPALEGLREHLRNRTVLLLLDNFEQILSAASVVTDLLATSPGLKIVVTSREPLRLRGEHEYAVPPLALPDAQTPSAPARLAEYAAVALFLQRATAMRGDFVLTSANAAAVVEVCARLDGLPLAIELAAARVRLLTPQAMAGRLERRLPLLVGGARDLPTRQQTLRGTIAWSHDLLDDHERRLFRRLTVFVGGWTLDAAESVCNADGGLDVLGGLESLVAKSLVRQHENAQGELRFGMLETIREYGLEQLALTGEMDALGRAHAVYFLELAELAEPRLRGVEQRARLDQLEAEHANMRAVLEWSLTEVERSDVALRLSGALAWFWASHAYTHEGLRWLTRALMAASPDPAVRLKALYGAGWLAHMHYDLPAARTYLHPALVLAQKHDNQWALAWTLHVLGRVAYYDNDSATARNLGEQSLAVARMLDDDWLVAWAFHLLGLAAHIAGDYPTASGHYEAALALRRRLGFQEGIAICLILLGLSAYHQGDYPDAHARSLESLRTLRAVGANWTLGVAFAVIAAIAALTQMDRAVRLAGATRRLSEWLTPAPMPLSEGILRAALERARDTLDEATFALAWAEGRAMSLEEATAEALAVEVPPSSGVPPTESLDQATS